MTIRRFINATFTGAIVLVITVLVMSYFKPIPLVEAGICGESPVGFYQMALVAYEVTDYGGGTVEVGKTHGNLFTMASYFVAGQPICTR